MDYRASLSLDVPHTPEELLDLEAIGKVIRFTPASILFGEGEETDFVLLIRKGHVNVQVGPWLVAVRKPGELIGEMAAIRGKPRSASVFAADEVEALYLPAEAWLRFLMKHPRAALAGRYSDEDRVEQATRKVREGEVGAAQRVARALVELRDYGLGAQDAKGLMLPVGQQDIAAYTRLSLAAIVKVIKAFKTGGVMSTGRMKVWIRDVEKLQKIAHGDDIASAE